MTTNNNQANENIELFDANEYIQLAGDDIFEDSLMLTIDEKNNEEDIYSEYEGYLREQKILKMEIISADKDGNLIIPIKDGITAVIPNEEVTGEHYDNRKRSFHLGETYIAVVTSIDRKNKKIYMSRNKAKLKAQEILKQRLISSLEENKSIRINARVRFVSFKSRRIYIDIGGCGLFGFIALQEWTHGFVYDPEKNIKPGTVIDVAVIGYKPQRGNLNEAFICSRKRVMPNPWETIGDIYPKNSLLITEAKDVQPGKFFGPVPGFDLEVYVEMPDNAGKPENEKIFIIPGRKYMVRIYNCDPEKRNFKAKVVKEVKENEDLHR